MWTGVVTNAGIALLAQWAAGGSLEIDGASAGTGTVPTAQLMSCTNVSGESHALSIIGYKTIEQGIKYLVQFTAAATAYVAMQVGIWARLNDGARTLIAIYQADSNSGISVPSVSELRDFAFTFGATVMMDNTGDLTVNIDESAWVTHRTMQEYLALKLDKANVYNGLDKSEAGYALDARQGAALKALIDRTIMIGETTTIAAGTTTKTLNGLTADHRVCFWGFSSGGENDPPADITVTTAANSYTITVSNVVNSGVTMTPVFILPQN